VQTFGLAASGESQPLPIAPPWRFFTAFKMTNIFYMRLSPIPFQGNANRFSGGLLKSEKQKQLENIDRVSLPLHEALPK
jgi:hypothetical protein